MAKVKSKGKTTTQRFVRPVKKGGSKPKKMTTTNSGGRKSSKGSKPIPFDAPTRGPAGPRPITGVLPGEPPPTRSPGPRGPHGRSTGPQRGGRHGSGRPGGSRRPRGGSDAIHTPAFGPGLNGVPYRPGGGPTPLPRVGGSVPGTTHTPKPGYSVATDLLSGLSAGVNKAVSRARERAGTSSSTSGSTRPGIWQGTSGTKLRKGRQY